MNLPQGLPLVVLLSLVACSGESSAPNDAAAVDAPPVIFPGMPGASPCPSATVATGSLWPDVVCDRGAGPVFNPRFVTVEVCAMNTGVYRPLTMRRPITSSHDYARTCPGVLLVTLNDAQSAYVGP